MLQAICLGHGGRHCQLQHGHPQCMSGSNTATRCRFMTYSQFPPIVWGKVDEIEVVVPSLFSHLMATTMLCCTWLTTSHLCSSSWNRQSPQKLEEPLAMHLICSSSWNRQSPQKLEEPLAMHLKNWESVPFPIIFRYETIGTSGHWLTLEHGVLGSGWA